MKNIILTFIPMLSIFFTSCLTTNAIESTPSNTIEIPVSLSKALHTIENHEEAQDYYFSFTAVNYGNVECQITIYDKQFMKMEQPETGAKHYYYYKFVGDYEEGLPHRSGIFGYAVDIETNAVYEIVFRNMFFGAYKFKSIADHKKNDKRYESGYITWNRFPDRRIPEPLYFLDFFEKKDKKLTSKTDEYGHKKDLAAKVYWSRSEEYGYSVTFNGDNK